MTDEATKVISVAAEHINVTKRVLVKKGANSDRLIAVGYGENKLLNDCDNSKKCSNLKHKENRRTEFKVF